MGLFDRMEGSIGSAIGGLFSRAFKSDVDPTEIAVGLQKQLDLGAKSLDKDRRLVPNDFCIYLARHDYDRLAPYSRTLNNEYIKGLTAYATTRHYVFNGPISIAYALDETLQTGRFSISSAVKAGVVRDQPRPVDTPSGARLVLEVNGVRHPLTPPGFSIGRGTEADLRINDPGVSRLHAQVRVEDLPGGQMRVTISDLGSTNGLIVDGQKVRSAELSERSRIEIGTTRMLVHSPVGG